MNIGVFFGSRNPEHEVSIITGQLIISGLKGLGYNIVPVYLGKDGGWFLGDELSSIDFFRKTQNRLSDLGKFYLDMEKSKGKMVFRKKGWLASKIITIDVAFPAFHGQNGEDGTIQGLFELLDIPYVGCGVAASAVAMDKVLTKLLFERHGFPTAKFVYFYENEWEKEKERISREISGKLAWPVFVKPSRLGSSIGISKADNAKELEFAIEVALHYDSKVLVEEGVKNVMDVTCAVLGDKNPKPSLLQESVFGDEFFSYEEKYLKEGGAQFGKSQSNIVIPARLDPDTTEKIRQLAVKVFSAFDCSGTARVDFLYDKDSNRIYVNEINTLPGTLYHHLWKASGIELGQLLKELITLAQERRKENKKLKLTFESDILKRADWSQKLNKKDKPT